MNKIDKQIDFQKKKKKKKKREREFSWCGYHARQRSNRIEYVCSNQIYEIV
jgi:hypothetical protein